MIFRMYVLINTPLQRGVAATLRLSTVLTVSIPGPAQTVRKTATQ